MKIDIINKLDYDLPNYETIGSAGMDLRANLKNDNISYIDLLPNKQYVIPTGIYISLPHPMIDNTTGEGWGYEAQIRPRSGLSSKYGLTILNSPGTIDSDYTGEIKIIMMNLGDKPYRIEHGDRIAQMVINRYEKISWNVVDELRKTERGSGGFSSTGIK